jgi:hypothetical protein
VWPLDLREILVHQVDTVVYESFGMIDVGDTAEFKARTQLKYD